MESTVKVKGENWHLNTSIQFTTVGMLIRVSLNVPKDLVRFLSPNNVIKGKNRYVYALRKHINSKDIHKSTVDRVHKMLLTNCMINIRRAKQELLGNEILKYGKQLSLAS